MMKTGIRVIVWFGLLLSFTAAAVDRSQVWVHTVDAEKIGIALAESDQANALRDTLIRPHLNSLPGGTSLNELRGEAAGVAILQLPAGTSRFTQGDLKVEGAEHVTVYVNGERQTTSNGSTSLVLQTGDHQILVLIEGAEEWSNVSIEWSGKQDHVRISTAMPDSLRINPVQIFDAQVTSFVNASPTGQYVVWRRDQFSPETGNTAQVDLQIYDVAQQRTLYRWQNGSAGSFAWHPDGQQLAWIEGGRVQLLDLSDLSLRQLTSSHTGIGGLHWLTSESLILSWNKQGEQDGGLTKRYRALEDRWTYFRNNSQLYVLNAASGVLRQLTQDATTLSFHDAHASGERILVTRRNVDYAEPPHSSSLLAEVDVASGELRDLGTHRTLNQAFYVGDDIYVVAGPEFGDGAGKNLPDDLLSNNYDGQLYRLLHDGSVNALSRDFDPSISNARAMANGDVLLQVTERDTTQLFRFRVEGQQFGRLNTGIDVVDTFSVTQEEIPRVVFAGTGATTPSRMGQMAVNASSASVIWDSAPEFYRHNTIRDVREWNFRNERGDTIYGRVYLPPNFNERQQYPALVYYYGGTTPVQRAFTGRYPFNLWAAQGYVVYVMQPTGTIGYGQEFSARHVNAWGEYTAEDIIQGTTRFLEAHDFVDADRVGHLGASYGGFMTMLVATMTDIFSASMSHAGISNITSYWGQGWWGFLYSGEASKGSFPWNNQELYTGRSPVYHADRVTAPMLLIHGDADTNVPAGESHMMYTALKVLGKEVELVEYLGEDHAINRREPRLHWWQTYMAFFDKHLKDQPEWWEYLYPEE
ncbi:MAG: S9 family peptidase [Idiomarina sp.]|nr:S9 family peptidase [Idiomarina sp.]